MNSPDNTQQTDELIARYHQIDDSGPSAELDAAILNYARASTRRPDRWIWPVSIAASLLLTVGFLARMGSLPPPEMADVPAASIAAPLESDRSTAQLSSNDSIIVLEEPELRPAVVPVGSSAAGENDSAEFMPVETSRTVDPERDASEVQSTFDSANGLTNSVTEQIVTVNPFEESTTDQLIVTPRAVQPSTQQIPADDSDQTTDESERKSTHRRQEQGTLQAVDSMSATVSESPDSKTHMIASAADDLESVMRLASLDEQGFLSELQSAWKQQDKLRFVNVFEAYLNKFPNIKWSADMQRWARDLDLDPAELMAKLSDADTQTD